MKLYLFSSGMDTVWKRGASPTRMDVPGALHHVMCPGMELRRSLRDNEDRRDFVDWFSRIRSGATVAPKRISGLKTDESNKIMGVPQA